jgi:RNA polymerase sigma-70 factor (ECF subfamily)
MQEPSDEDLMLRVARGDQAAFRLLALRYTGRAVGLARRTTGSDADAEEIVQEALLRLWINAPRWRPVAAFRTWFYRVVVNLALNRRRRPPLLALEQAGDPVDPAADPGERLERAQLDRQVASAIAELPAQQRAAVTLAYAEGLSNAETAAVLDTSVAAVESLLVRARRSLRAKLGPMLDGSA